MRTAVVTVRRVPHKKRDAYQFVKEVHSVFFVAFTHLCYRGSKRVKKLVIPKSCYGSTRSIDKPIGQVTKLEMTWKIVTQN